MVVPVAKLPVENIPTLAPVPPRVIEIILFLKSNVENVLVPPVK